VQLEAAGEEQLTCLAALPGGALLICGSSSGDLKRVALEAGATPSLTLSGHTGPVLCCCVFTLTGAVLAASGSADGSCRVWDARGGACECVLTHAASDSVMVNAVSFAELGGTPLLVTAHSDYAVRVWNGRTAAAASGGALAPLAVLQEHADAVLACAATARQLVSASMDASVKFWSWTGGAGALEHSTYDFIRAVTRLRVAQVGEVEVRVEGWGVWLLVHG